MKKTNDNEKAVLAAIQAMPEQYRNMGERIHNIIKNNAPNLTPKLWYGMPAYSDKNGNIICFFRSGEKFKERYMTLGFNQWAKLDKGNIWPVAYALTKLTPTEETKITTLIKKATK